MSRTFAYLRVSTSDQTTENQIQEIRAAGFDVKANRVVAETISGATQAKDRPGFSDLLKRMEEDDVLIVTKLDRLGRDAIDVQTTVKTLGEAGIRVRCLALGDVDLTGSAGKMMVTMLAAMAELERDLLVERTKAGLARAISQGKKLGRPAMMTDKRKAAFADAVRKAQEGGQRVNWSKLAGELEVSRATLWRAVNASAKEA